MTAPGKEGISHVFISRPQPQAGELAAMVEQLGLETIVQPAFEFSRLDLASEQPGLLEEMGAAPSPLLVFTSTRSVIHGLDQVPKPALQQGRVAAIGPATARALGAAGIRVAVEPRGGYSSEALLEVLAKENEGQRPGRRRAYIMAAPGGREKLEAGLKERGWRVRMAMVYRPQAVPIDAANLEAIESARRILAVWTSANAMKSLSQRLPPSAWFRLSSGPWLVISERLQRLSRAYGPEAIHLARGPGNDRIVASIRGLI